MILRQNKGKTKSIDAFEYIVDDKINKMNEKMKFEKKTSNLRTKKFLKRIKKYKIYDGFKKIEAKE